MRKAIAALFALGAFAVLPASAGPTPNAEAIRSQTTAGVVKVYDDDHSRWRSHNRWGSYGEHGRWRSHNRYGSDRRYDDDWHNRWRSHNRWGSDNHDDWHNRWRSHRRWGSGEY